MSFACRSYRVYHGGSWRSAPKYAQVAICSYGTMYRRGNVIGLRLVRTCT